MTTTVGDLILEGISFLNIPEDLKPPEQGKYAIEAQTEFSEEVLKAKGEEIRGLIGTRIPQQPSTFTPLQKKKITVIATGLLALGGAAWLAASVPAMIPIAGIVMVASGVLIPYKLYQYCSRYDLDLDSERTPLRLSIRKWDIAKLTKTFSFEELIGYDLLQGKLGTLDEISKARSYAYMEALYYSEAKVHKEEEKLLTLAWRTYRAGTAAYNNWIEQVRLKSAVIDMSHWRDREQERWRDGYSSHMDLARDGMRLTAEYKHTQLKAPWVCWLQMEKTLIEQASQRAIEHLNETYQQHQWVETPPA